MHLSFKISNDTETILEEVARVRALPQLEQMQLLQKKVAEWTDQINCSPEAEAIRAYLDEQEEIGNRSIREFIARHAHLIVLPSD